MSSFIAPWRAFHRAHLHDYGPAATAIWTAIVAAGVASLAGAILGALSGGHGWGWPVAFMFGAVALSASFAMQVPRTKYSLSVADVFVFLLLTSH